MAASGSARRHRVKEHNSSPWDWEQKADMQERIRPLSLQTGILLLQFLKGSPGEVSRNDTGSREGAADACRAQSYLENGSFSQQPLGQVLARQLSRGLQLLVPVSGLKESKPRGKQYIVWDGAAKSAFLLYEAFCESRERKGQEFRLPWSSEEVN